MLDALAGRRARASRSARPASTSTTSTRRATSRRRRSGARSGSRTRLDRPLVIHSRDAWDDTFRVLDDEGVPERTIFHCFTGGPDEAAARARPRLLPVVQRHRVVQERRRRARRGARSRPPTGCSSRPTARTSRPMPYRGKPNEPAFVVAVGAALARGARRRRRRDRRAHARERGAGVRRRAVTPSEIQRAARRARRAAEQGARSELPRRHRTWPRASCGSRACSPATASSRSGPGSGRSRSRCADAGAHVRAVELDRHLAARARRRSSRARDVEIVHGDALDRRLAPSCSATATAGSMVSNLPYNVATPVVVRALETAPMIERFLVMVQREVGERLAAAPGDEGVRRGVGEGRVLRGRRRWSARCRRRCSCRSPNVESALVRLVRHARRRSPSPTRRGMFELVRAGFATRRKMLRRALGAALGATPSDVRARRASIRRRGPRRSTLAEWARARDAVRRE